MIGLSHQIRGFAFAVIGTLSLVAAVAFVHWTGIQAGIREANAQWQAKWDQQALQLAKAKADALEAARTEEQRRIKAVEEITNATKKHIEQARADAAAASAVADSLHDKASRLATAGSQCTSDTAAKVRSAAARATNAVVLADVFKRADAAAGRLAAAYDQARAAGLACERAYDALHNTNSSTQR